MANKSLIKKKDTAPLLLKQLLPICATLQNLLHIPSNEVSSDVERDSHEMSQKNSIIK